MKTHVQETEIGCTKYGNPNLVELQKFAWSWKLENKNGHNFVESVHQFQSVNYYIVPRLVDELLMVCCGKSRDVVVA